jgi:hypothetical protein
MCYDSKVVYSYQLECGLMKKNILFIIVAVVILFSGCSKKQPQMTNFIPTQAPETEDGDSLDASEDSAQNSDTSPEDAELTPTPKTIHVGETTTKYVKMGEYDAVLNVRATPSKSGEVVGFLVHTEKIEVIDIVDGWASFEYKGAICYVSADYLVDTRPDYIAPPSPTPIPDPVEAPSPTAISEPEAEEGNDAPPEI